MAKLAGVTIADKNAEFAAGAAFLLSKPCVKSEVIAIDANWQVEVRAGSPYIIARSNSNDLNNLPEQAQEAAQKSLDFLSICGIDNLCIRHTFDEFLIWWRKNSQQILRIVFVVRENFDSLAAIHNVKHLTPIYHESLRYFRLAQVTDDLFDAYRNLYLALELLISHQVPKSPRKSERKWLKESLGEINQLFPTFPIIDEVTIDELYNIRCNLFHARANEERLLPHNLADCQRVSQALEAIAQIFIQLASHLLKVRNSSSSAFSGGFKYISELIVPESKIILSEQAISTASADEILINLNASSMALEAKYEPNLGAPFVSFVLGAIASPHLQRLKQISEIVWTGKSLIISTNKLAAELIIDSIDTLEVQMGLGLINFRQPKYFFQV